MVVSSPLRRCGGAIITPLPLETVLSLLVKSPNVRQRFIPSDGPN